jgi:pimeloyl-ACP methyl ester carboxylesterase
MPQFTRAGRDLHYEIHGQGESLVLIPGFAAGAWIWFRQSGRLSAQFRVITFDPPGIGPSAYSERPPDMRFIAEDVAGLLQSLGIKQAHILGASFGGFVAQEFALAYPGMTRTLHLCCTSFGGPNHVAASMETLGAVASSDGFNTEERIRRLLMPAFSPEFAREHPEEVDALVARRMANPVDQRAYRWQLAAAMAFNTESRIPELRIPTLVITGDSDQIVPPQNSRNLAAKIPDAQLISIEGGSHLFFLERPDEFNSVIEKFLLEH